MAVLFELGRYLEALQAAEPAPESELRDELRVAASRAAFTATPPALDVRWPSEVPNMRVRARVRNSEGRHDVTLCTNDTEHPLAIPPKTTGFGSSANGGELLFLALATCYCNDVYREAAKRGLRVERVEVEVEGDFGTEGEPAKNVTYRAKVTADASESDIRALMVHTDGVAEIQNTLRIGTPVTLAGIEVVATSGTPAVHAARRT
jgi:organic hydroperoxide reductase OsmC/OhrA